MPDLSSPASQGILRSDKPTTQTSSQTSATPTAPGLGKELEPFPSSELGKIEEVGKDIEVSPELVQYGVQKRSEVIDLPPDIAKMGVSAIGAAQPVTYTGAVKLPLTDDQIMVGLHAQIVSSIRWMAEWCVRRLKQAHIHLKKTQGKIIRETEGQFK